MALTDSLPTGDAGGLTVADERLILAGLIAKNADGTPRVGVFAAGNGALVTGRATMGYDIALFKGVSSRTGTGVELVANDAQTTVATTAAPGSNSRIDVIWWRPQFTVNTDPGNVPIFGVTQGTAAGVPTKPAIPAGAVELASAEVPSTATNTASVVITQSAQWTAAAGGVIPIRSSVELAAFPAADGTLAREISTGVIHQRVAGSWAVLLRPLSAYTPTVTGLSGVTTTAKASRVGDHVHGEVKILRTSQASPTGTVSISLPYPMADTTTPDHLGVGLFAIGGGGTQYDVRARYAGGTSIVIAFPGVAGSAIGAGQNLSATFPTSAPHPVGTSLKIRFDYEAAP